MQVFRFDEEVSIPISEFGSQFRVGPLTGADARVRVQVVYLPPGGQIGRHAALVRQLFAVVAGSGWVTGQQGDRRDIGPGYGAVWEPGEEHGAGTAGGLSAVCVEGEFDVWATRVTQEIVVTDYDAQWPRWFEKIQSHVWPAVAGVAARIEHVGSTSVQGMPAKPIIDMDVVVVSADDIRPVIDRLATIGYRWRGDLGVAGREAFTAAHDHGLPPHHLYLVVEGSRAHLDHVLLRDLLRSEAVGRRRYADLKRSNVVLAAGDMDVYVAAKAGLVAELLARARAERGLPPVTYWAPRSGTPDISTGAEGPCGERTT